MDPSKYKTVRTTRGFTFPSTSQHWKYQATYFAKKGYGVVVPDMLGFAGTDKPTDPAEYVGSKLSKDLMDILDAENIPRVVAIGHDWGSAAVSKLANHYPERIIAYAFISVPYVPPSLHGNFQDRLDSFWEKFGYELYGYWYFFAEGDIDGAFRRHPDSFVSILYPAEPELWRTHMAPVGALQKAIESGFTAPLPSWMSPEDKEYIVKTFTEGGLEAPTCWYKVAIHGLGTKDDQNIPASRAVPPKTAPIFYAAAMKDYVCRPELGYDVFQKLFQDHNVTIQEFDGDHWVMMSQPNKINKALEAWVENTVKTKGNL